MPYTFEVTPFKTKENRRCGLAAVEQRQGHSSEAASSDRAAQRSLAPAKSVQTREDWGKASGSDQTEARSLQCEVQGPQMSGVKLQMQVFRSGMRFTTQGQK